MISTINPAPWAARCVLPVLAMALFALAAMPAVAFGADSTLPPLRNVAAEAADAARRGEPLVVLVTLPGCHYCETVRRGYLAPQAARGEVIVREVDMAASTPLRDAAGQITTARDWVRGHGVRVAPTVLFLDADGRSAAPPLRGIQPDFYGAYLEQALEAARAKVRAGQPGQPPGQPQGLRAGSVPAGPSIVSR